MHGQQNIKNNVILRFIYSASELIFCD